MNKFTPEEINKLLSQSKDVPDSLKNGLSDEQTKKLNSILSDKDAINAILQSDKAQEILKKFKGGS